MIIVWSWDERSMDLTSNEVDPALPVIPQPIEAWSAGCPDEYDVVQLENRSQGNLCARTTLSINGDYPTYIYTGEGAEAEARADHESIQRDFPYGRSAHGAAGYDGMPYTRPVS